jgi:hypothetical protein
MPLSDRIYWWLVAMGSLALVAAGVAVFWYSPVGKKWGAALIGVGICLFAFGGPDDATKKGYKF